MPATQTRPISLPASPTYAIRAADLDDGDLVIWTARQETGPLTVRRYGLEEIRPDRPGCRAFLLTKEDGSDYVTIIGGMPGCDCKAGEKGKKRGNCAHLDALTALVRDGRLPPSAWE